MFQSVEITPQYVKIIFEQTPSVATLLNQNFRLYQGLGDDDNIAGLTEVLKTEQDGSTTSPFRTIDPEYHYKSLSRTLYLFFKDGILANDQFYTLHATIRSASGQDLRGYIYFGFGTLGEYDAARFEDLQNLAAIDPDAPVVEDPDNTGPAAPIEIRDYSLRHDVFSQIAGLSDGQFRVTGSDPAANEIYVEEDYADGRIMVHFNARPANRYVSPEYFRLQKKAFDARSTTRWQTVENLLTAISAGGNTVYLYLPSVEEEGVESVYNTPGRVYFEDGYKYRLKVSGEIGTSA